MSFRLRSRSRQEILQRAAIGALLLTGIASVGMPANAQSQDRDNRQSRPMSPPPSYRPTPLAPNFRPIQPATGFPMLPGGLTPMGQIPVIRPVLTPGNTRPYVPNPPAVYPSYGPVPSGGVYLYPGTAVVNSDAWGQVVVPTGGNRYNRGQVTSIEVPGGTRITLFNGYARRYIPGQAVYSPFGAVYGCAPYIASSYVLTTGYPYVSYTETAPVQAWSDTDPYINTNPRRARALRTALNDLSRFWEDEDFAALRRHTAPDMTVAVFQGERFNYSLQRSDFLDLSSDTLDTVSTAGFRFLSVQERNDGLVNAYARHTYRIRGESGSRTATVRYTLVFVDGDWYVSAVSLPQ